MPAVEGNAGPDQMCIRDSPLFSVVGTSVMSNFITHNLGGDYRPFYIGLCIIPVSYTHLIPRSRSSGALSMLE